MPASTATPKRRGRKPGSVVPLSANAVNRELRAMWMTSLNFVGGVKYLNWLAKKHPSVYMQGLARLIKTGDSGTMGDDAGITFVVQQINVTAGPVQGVLASPVAAHVQPPLRLAAAGGEVVEDVLP